MIAEHLNRHWPRLVVSLLILTFFALHSTKQIEWPFLVRLENIAYDMRLLFTMPSTLDDRIVIVDIDEKSLAEEGRWPWGRDRIAVMTDQLFERYNALIVGFDVVFAEPEETSGQRVLEELADLHGDDPDIVETIAELGSELDHDAAFARSLADRPAVLGYFFEHKDSFGRVAEVGALPEPVLRAGSFAGRYVNPRRADGYAANLPILQEQAWGAGHFVTVPDPDGVLRKVPMLYEYEDAYYESLSLAIARRVLGVEDIEPGFPTDSQAGTRYSTIEWLQVGDRRIPVNPDLEALIPYRGNRGSFPYVSAVDVINGEIPVDAIEGRIVLLGTTAKGLFDLRAAPVAAAYPGVEAHANLIAGILDESVKVNPAYTVGAEVILLVLTGIIMALILPAMSPLWATVLTAVLAVGVLITNLVIWNFANFVFPLANGLATILTMFLFNMTYGYFFEQRGKRQLAGLFGQYVPPELVDEMSQRPDLISMDSESRELTVLFSDVRGFTTISEGLEPRELSELMNAFLTPMTGIIHRNRGTIDKYMGDAIMAFWGAPLDDPEHARHALEAALEMIERLEVMQGEFKARGWPEIKIGVGLNTGPMSVGNMGSEFRRAYTVLGDAVNLGSRLEGLTKEYGVQLIVSETTAAAVPDYAYLELDRVRVKGKDEPVTIYEPQGPKDTLDKSVRDEIKLYREALRQYRSQNWDLAEISFLNLEKANPARALYPLYAERTAYYRQDPPESDWDGVFTFKTK